MMIDDALLSEAISVLQKLVQADSENPPGDTGKCAGLIGGLLDREGIPYRIEEPKEGVRSVVAALEGARPAGSGKPKTLLFNGHIDTVPAGPGWSVDPFGGEIRDGFLYGRGSTDMKAGIAASLMALVDLKRRGAPFAGKIIFTAVGDEEYHSQFGTKYLIEKGLTADFAINCEPTNLDMCLGNRGLLMVDVTVKGRSSHGGRPGLGKNAIDLACRIIDGLNSLDFESSRDDRFKDPVGSLSIVGISGGDRLNVIPDNCVFYIDRRMMPGESSAEAIRQIEEVIRQVAGKPPVKSRAELSPGEGRNILISPEVWHEPFWMGEDNPYVLQCVDIYRTVFGKAPVFEGKSAGTDASHLVSMGKIPTIIFGPGDYRASHTLDEKVELAQLGGAIKFYNAAVEKLLAD